MDFSSLWVDKHRPSKFGDLNCNHELTKKLQQLAKCDDLPHIVFYGPSGAGKKTRIMCLLQSIFGDGVYKFNKSIYSTKVNSKTVEVPLLSSQFHMDLTPSDAGNNDRVVIQTLIKESASSGSVGLKNPKKFTSVILNEADNLTKDAQASLRRTMEKYVDKVRLILVCENLGNLIPALLSRCLLIRVSAPSKEEIVSVLGTILKREKSSISEAELESIASGTRNLRKSIFILQNEALRSVGGIKRGEETENWQKAIQKMALSIMKEQTPQMLEKLRCYDLLTNCIPGGEIISCLLKALLPKFKMEYQPALIEYALKYENMMCKGSKAVMFIEAFMAQAMVLANKQIKGVAL